MVNGKLQLQSPSRLQPGRRGAPSVYLSPSQRPGERLEDFRARIGQVFDDTLQLQLDVLGQNYGLSKVPRHAATVHDRSVGIVRLGR